MRANRVAILLLLMASPTVFAQGDDVTSVLRGWEKSLADAKTIKCEVRRDVRDAPLDTRDIYEGFLIFAKDAGRQRFRYEVKKSGKLSEKMIADGKDLYEYVPATKVVRVHNMPGANDGALGLLSLMFDINPQRAQAKYTMTLDKANDESDKHYHYIRIKPKGGKNEFQEAKVALARSDHMPRQFAYQQLNNVVTVWTFENLKLNEPIPEKLLAPDTDGWRVERVQPRPPGK